MSEQNKDVVRKYYEVVINGRNLDAVVDFFADERMVEGVRRGCFSYFAAFPDLHVSLDELIAEGDSRLPPLDDDRDARRRVQGDSAHRPAHRDGVRRGLPDRGRQVRRLLVPDERRRPDAADHRGAGRRGCARDRLTVNRLNHNRRSRHAESIESDCLGTSRGRGLRGTVRALGGRLLGRLREVHGRRRPGAALRRPPRRPLPVPALGLRHQGEGEVHLRGRPFRDVRGGRRVLRTARTHPDPLRRQSSSWSSIRPRSSRRRWRSSPRTWRRPP